jgi:KDO2-lipid IV(A) lauroyltransferase
MYYLVYGIFYIISLLPIRVLYVLADAFYGLIYYVIGYRKGVVMSNLAIAFPEKTEAEKVAIAKKFYHNFVDNFIETIKMVSASDAYILKRFTGNWNLLNEVLESGSCGHILLGHTFNWEWGNLAIGLNMHSNLLVVYMPISNKVLDRLFLKLRTRGKTRMLSAHNMRKELMPYRNTQYTLGLAADQNPGAPNNAYWLNFFSKAAPFVTGPEKGARSKNLPVFFCYIEKLRRGYYNMVVSIGETNPKALPEGALTIKFVKYLEDIIRMQPDMWLWSHNRWKHQWKDEYVKLWIDAEPPLV